MREEKDIQKNWNKSFHNPVVSIVCVSYNQKSYIKDAIESFLMQETTFPFEIIIHDDASTDGTAEIIKKYVERYPTIIKAIFQKENQYSQKGFSFLKSVYALAQGEFIAVCDGDDYWTDSKKIEYQVVEMRKNPFCDMCFHAIFTKDSNDQNATLVTHGAISKIFSIQEIILGGGGFCPTVSLMIKNDIFKKLPDFVFSSPVLDYPIQILSARQGGGLYLSKPMAIYRVKAVASWSEKTQKSVVVYVDQSKKLVNTLKSLDQYTSKKYHKEINRVIMKIKFKILCKKADGFLRSKA